MEAVPEPGAPKFGTVPSAVLLGLDKGFAEICVVAGAPLPGCDKEPLDMAVPDTPADDELSIDASSVPLCHVNDQLKDEDKVGVDIPEDCRPLAAGIDCDSVGPLLEKPDNATCLGEEGNTRPLDGKLKLEIE